MPTLLRRALIAGALLALGSSASVAASHTHVLELGNGSCVILAPDAGEESVRLPFAGEFAPDRQHPLHVLVHLGAAGHDRVWVQGSAGDLDNCTGYVNVAADQE